MNIQFPILFGGSNADKELLVVFDPETMYSFLPENFIQKIGGLSRLSKPKLLEINCENRHVLVSHRTSAEFIINNVRLSDEFMSLPGDSDHAIIGALTIRKWRMKLDHENNAVIINPEVGRFRLGGGLREVKK